MKNIHSYYLKKLILDAVKKYNKNKSQKSISKLVLIEKNDFIIEFENIFNSNSNFFGDFMNEFEEISKFYKLKIIEIKSENKQKFLVRFQFVDHDDKFENDPLFQKFLKTRNLSFEQYLALNSCSKDVIRFHFRTWLFERNEK